MVMEVPAAAVVPKVAAEAMVVVVEAMVMAVKAQIARVPRHSGSLRTKVRACEANQ